MSLTKLLRSAFLAILAAGIGVDARAGEAGGLLDLDGLMRTAAQAERDGHDAQAAALFWRAHQADPTGTGALHALAELAARTGDAEAAYALFSAVLAIDPDHRAAKRGLGLSLLELGRGDDAVAVFDALLAQDATDPLAWNGKGLALELLDRPSAAQRAYRSGLAHAPGDPDLLANLLSAATGAAVPRAAPVGTELAFNVESGAGRSVNRGFTPTALPSVVRD